MNFFLKHIIQRRKTGDGRPKQTPVFRLLSSVFLFSSFTAIIYVGLVILWGEFASDAFKQNLNYRIGSYGHMHSRIQEIPQTKDIDILFLGSSHCYRGFDPRIFAQKGLKAFNLGSSSQTHLQSNILLKRYLDQLNPKTLIYEVYPEMFTMDGVESTLDLIANDDNYTYLNSLVLKQNNSKVYNTYIYGVYQKVFNRHSTYVEKVDKENDKYINGGFVEKKMTYFKYKTYPTPYTWSLRKDQIKAFEESLKMIKERNIDLILIQAPITSRLYNACASRTDFDTKMNNYGKYYNFNEIMLLYDSLHFYNAEHLNQRGVEKFNEELLQIIKPAAQRRDW